jgi:hypothetical protein
VDEGQRIHPVALSALRNALQNIGAGYMLVLALRNVSLDASNVTEGPRIIEDIANRSEDTGLPRLFGNNYASLGPFDTQQEADECIRKRLTGRDIQFAPSVISDIGRVTGRFPKTMMDLANEVYTLAQMATPTIQTADEGLMTQAFVSVYRNLVDEATEFVAPYTNTKKMVVRVALEHEGSFTPLQVARKILKGAATLNEDAFADDPVSIALDQLVASKYCLKKGTEYQWAGPLRTHSLRLSLI